MYFKLLRSKCICTKNFFLKDGLELAKSVSKCRFLRNIFKKVIPTCIFLESVFEIPNSVFHISSGSKYYTYSSHHKNENKF